MSWFGWRRQTPSDQGIPPIPAELAERLPTDPATGAPLPPRAQPGYYPGNDVLAQQDTWDEATRRVVLDRVNNVPPFRFFTSAEIPLLRAVCARLLPQDDRDEAHRIPIAEHIDARLHAGRIDGYRYDDMPSDGEAHRLGLHGIEAIARQLHGRMFVALAPGEQDAVLQTLHDTHHGTEPPAGEDIWRRLPPDRYWLLLLQDVVGVYYAHPYAWDEIGFGGPAYPRGYMRLTKGQPEPWEGNEARYDWEPPASARSGGYRPLGGSHPGRQQTPGQGGTH